MTWILSREFVIVTALLGGAAALLATLPRIRSVGLARRFNLVAYALMGGSVLVFIIIGLRSG